MESRRCRVAVVGGAGTWGKHYTQAYAERHDCEIVALVDRAEERCQSFAEHYGIQHTYRSIEDLLSTEVPDIVSASIPVAYIHDTVIACAEAGVKVVSCEKPLDYQLSRADNTVKVCLERGTAFGCGTAHWSEPFLPETVAWLRQGHIGKLTGAAIPIGFDNEVSGGGCHSLTLMRFVTGMDVEWVEGVVHPPESNFQAQEAQVESEIDRPAYGNLGLSGGIVCTVIDPKINIHGYCSVSVLGENGGVWISRPKPVLIEGSGAMASPVFPEFLNGPPQQPGAMYMIRHAVSRLVEAFASGSSDVPCSGADYLHALEIAIAITHSAANDGVRIQLPLEDRSLKLYPHPYRLYGGDQAGWQSIGYSGPPELPGKFET